MFNAAGQRVKSLMNGIVPAGQSRLAWDGRNSAGQPAASGAYFCRMTAEDGSRVVRVVLMR
jgi:flagellar hook assembly protein FlgD